MIYEALTTRHKLRSIAILGAFLVGVGSASARDSYVQKWEKITEMLYLDANSVAHTTDGGVYANAYFGPAGTMNVESFRHLYLDCKGSYTNATMFDAPVLPAVPGTAIGEFAAAACAAPKGSAARAAHTTQLQRVASNSPVERPDQTTVMLGTRVSGFHLSLMVSNEKFPRVYGTTDFPDDTELLITIRKPWQPDAMQRAYSGRAMCADDCSPATGPRGQPEDRVFVRGGKFTVGPFSWLKKPFQQGEYVVDVYLAQMPNEPREPNGSMMSARVARFQLPIFSTSAHITP